MLRVFFLQTLDKSRVPTEETAHARPRGNLERAAPRRGSSYCWPWALSGVGDAPRRRGPTAGAPRPAAPARFLRAPDGSAPREADRKERPDLPAGYARTDARVPAHRRACPARTDAHTPRAPTRLPGAHRPRTCDAHDAFFRRADARIRRTQCALTRRETRVTTLTFLV